MKLEVLRVVVFEDIFGSVTVPDALDHAGVVALVTEDLAAQQLGVQGVECRVIGDITRGEDQRCLLLVERGHLRAEFCSTCSTHLANTTISSKSLSTLCSIHVLVYIYLIYLKKFLE